MKILALLTATLSSIQLASAACNWQNFGCSGTEKCWRLSTYHEDDCIDQAGTWVHKGIGHHCINLPGKTRSFIFNVSPNYNNPVERCTVFFTKGNTCSGETVGRSEGSWKKSSLTAKGRTMGSAVVQCTTFFPGKR